jgi:hypothetical protein
MPYCKNCGAQVPETAKFCKACGALQPNRLAAAPEAHAFAPENPFAASAPKKRKRGGGKKNSRSVLAVVLVVVLVFGGLAAFAFVLIPHIGQQLGIRGKDIPSKGSAAKMHVYFEGYKPNGKKQSKANKAYWNRVSYEVGDISLNSDTEGTATVIIKTPDMKYVMAETIAWMYSDKTQGKTAEELTELFQTEIVRRIKKASSETIEITMSIKLIDSKWYFVPNAEWQARLFGNGGDVLAEAFKDYMDALLKGMESQEAAL